MMPAAENDEQLVLLTTPMPKGYTFVRKGNVYVTAHCRRATHAEGRVVYVVVSPSKAKTVLGIRCPQHIVDAVRATERTSREARHAATEKRDDALAATFREALLERYPHVPPDTVLRIVQHAMKKHAGRVARTGTLELATRVRLAVRAHIRHCWTDYDALLREKLEAGEGAQKKSKKKTRRGGKENQKLRNEVRQLTISRVDAIEQQWAGRMLQKEGIDGKKSKDKPTTDEKKAREKTSRSGKGSIVAGNNTKAGRSGRNDIVHDNNRVQKTKRAPTTRSRRTMASPGAIAKLQGSKKETAIVIDSDDDVDGKDDGSVDDDSDDFIVLDDDYDSGDSYSNSSDWQ